MYCTSKVRQKKLTLGVQFKEAPIFIILECIIKVLFLLVFSPRILKKYTKLKNSVYFLSFFDFY